MHGSGRIASIVSFRRGPPLRPPAVNMGHVKMRVESQSNMVYVRDLSR